jgi:hypothetical protein
MEIKEHSESYNVRLTEGEEVSITVGTVTKSWTVATGKTGTFKIKFAEQIQETPP